MPCYLLDTIVFCARPALDMSPTIQHIVWYWNETRRFIHVTWKLMKEHPCHHFHAIMVCLKACLYKRKENIYDERVILYTLLKRDYIQREMRDAWKLREFYTTEIVLLYRVLCWYIIVYFSFDVLFIIIIEKKTYITCFTFEWKRRVPDVLWYKSRKDICSYKRAYAICLKNDQRELEVIIETEKWINEQRAVLKQEVKNACSPSVWLTVLVLTVNMPN